MVSMIMPHLRAPDPGYEKSMYARQKEPYASLMAERGQTQEHSEIWRKSIYKGRLDDISMKSATVK